MLGTSTGQAADVDTPNAATLVPDGVAGLPLAEADEATGKLIFTYIRRKSSTDPGVTYSVEFSDDLGSWAENLSATASATALTGADSDFERVEITDTTASPARRFARLKVVVTP